MHAPGFLQILIIVGLLFLLFGRPGRLSAMMEDLGKGLKGFRKGLDESKPAEPAAPAPVETPPRQILDMSKDGETAPDRERSL